MCTYTTHIRICARCAREDTVLISEQLCLVAKASGIFGSCLEGILSERDVTGCLCWQCKEGAVVRVVARGVSGSGRQGTGVGTGLMGTGAGGGVGMVAGGGVGVPVGVGVGGGGRLVGRLKRMSAVRRSTGRAGGVVNGLGSGSGSGVSGRWS